MLNNVKKYFQTIFRWIVEKFNTSEDNFVISQNFELYSVALQRQVKIEALLPPGFSPQQSRQYPFLLVNDGQDFEALQMKTCLQGLYEQKKRKPIMVFGIWAADRIQEYGTSEPLDYQNRGAKSKAYAQFITEELLPYLYANFPCRPKAEDHSFAGFSLGGLSAIDIVWRYPEHFGQVGVFSGALWWRSTPFDPKNPDANRIMHHLVDRGPQKKGLRFWFQTGTLDEESDRNNNGVIDAIDDTLDLIEALKRRGYAAESIHYLEVEGGEHNPQTWGKVMDDFLCWLN